MARWERIRLPLQETEVQSLIWGDPTRFSATESAGQTVEPWKHSHAGPHVLDGACAPRERPPS